MSINGSVDVRGLPPYAQLLYRQLPRLAKGHDECFTGNRKLAEVLGCCEKTVRNALAALRAAGLIEVVRDYSLRTRRRIVLLWRQARECLPFMAANASPESPVTFAATDATPLNRCPEGELTRESDGCAESACDPPPTADPLPPPPSPLSIDRPEPTRKATAGELATAEAKASKVLGSSDGSAGSWVRSQARRWGLGWVIAALDRAEAKQARETLRNPRGYVVRVLEGFAAEGGPPPAPPTPEESDASFMDRLQAYLREQEAAFEAYGN